MKEFPGITLWPIMCQKSKKDEKGFDLRFIVTDFTVTMDKIIPRLEPGESIGYWRDEKIIGRHTWENILYYFNGASDGKVQTYNFLENTAEIIKKSYAYCYFEGDDSLKKLYKLIALCAKVGVKFCYQYEPIAFFIPFVTKELNEKLEETKLTEFYEKLKKNVFMNDEDEESIFINSCVNTGINATKAYKPLIIINN